MSSDGCSAWYLFAAGSDLFHVFDKCVFIADPDLMNTIWPRTSVGRDHRNAEKQGLADRDRIAVEERRPQQNVGVIDQVQRDGVLDIARRDRYSPHNHVAETACSTSLSDRTVADYHHPAFGSSAKISFIAAT